MLHCFRKQNSRYLIQILSSQLIMEQDNTDLKFNSAAISRMCWKWKSCVFIADGRACHCMLKSEKSRDSPVMLRSWVRLPAGRDRCCVRWPAAGLLLDSQQACVRLLFPRPSSEAAVCGGRTSIPAAGSRKMRGSEVPRWSDQMERKYI